MSNDPRPFFTQRIMDPISPTFCAAKWYEGTIWLYMGATASCHHNPFHQITLNPTDPSSIHNTPQKVEERKALLNGEQPRGCNYCWSIEKTGEESDRHAKSKAIELYIPENWKNKENIPMSVTPLRLEIAFDRECNLACAYCGPAFSSKWAVDITTKGSYEMKVDTRFNYDVPNIIKEDHNPYIDAFMEWWPTLSNTLLQLKITGGEPLSSKRFWEFLKITNDANHFKGMLSINSNLIHSKRKIDMLLANSTNLDLTVHTSLESSLSDAEYSRDGFDQDIWLASVHNILSNSPSKVMISTSINNLTVWTMKEFLELVSDFKNQYGADRVATGFNFVYRPACMQIQLIPKYMRKNIVDVCVAWRDSTDPTWYELDNINRCISFIGDAEFDEQSAFASREDAITGLKNFVAKYDVRRKKDHRVDLSSKFNDWFITL